MRVVKTSFGEYIEGGIYKHWKGNYYMINCISRLHGSDIFLINYHQCSDKGIYISIRENIGTSNEKIIHQPFCTHETRWFDEVEVNGVKQKRFELVYKPIKVMGEPVKFAVEHDVAYGNVIKTPKISKKADVYSALEQAIKDLVGVLEGKPNSEAIFVKNEQLASATLSKKLKSMLPADGSFVYKVRKQKDEQGKVIGVRVYKFLTPPTSTGGIV